ncbi:MAG: MnmC family methyltransferase, partial [Pseudobdellovibrio sp.]
ESMHHSGGAAAETEYIYKSVIEKSLQVKPGARLGVVGLGLGYIEISWALAVIKNNLQIDPPSVVSYEIDEELKIKFKEWCERRDLKTFIYDQMVEALETGFDHELIKNLITQKTEFKGDLLTDYEKDKSLNIVCYDAFSSKTTAALWSEDFLNQFIQKACAEDCVFTTYACTGVLKKVLKENGFILLTRLGFKGKRDSTLAVRGKFKSVTYITENAKSDF